MASAAPKTTQYFTQKLAKNLILANYKSNQVKFPLVEQFTLNIKFGPADKLSGLRYFNNNLAPGFRLANDELKWVVNTSNRDKSIKKTTVDILFKDGKTAQYNPFGKDSVEIYEDLAKLGRGNYWLKNQHRRPTKPVLGQPELTMVEQ